MGNTQKEEIQDCSIASVLESSKQISGQYNPVENG